jgi:bifunctional aspartokinase / homoserine dehydrogenase 1
MQILKFGGSSVGNSDRIKNVAEILKKRSFKSKKIIVVLSAFQGVTDELISTSITASKGDINYKLTLRKIEDNHINVIKALLPVKEQTAILSFVKLTLNELEDVLHGVFLVKELSPRTLDFIMSFGERLSCYITANYLKTIGVKAEYIDSRTLIRTDDSFGNAKVDFTITNKNIREALKNFTGVKIITGFIASTLNNETTTLGRGGSDYTASIIAAALDAKEIEIWTDVNGVLTADPRKVLNSFSINSLSYEEAMELSHFGAKVIYPPTMHPALNKKIPLRIKNTFNPSFEGTLISSKTNGSGFLIKGISSIDNISLISIHGSGMVGVAGISQRIFGALAAKNISVILITQASSEHSLCFAVLPLAALSAKKAIEQEFRFEIKEGLINEPEVENSMSIIAVVGENMRRTPGISGKVFNSLGRNGINIAAIAQGSSERNISVVIWQQDESKALNVLHDAFFLSPAKSVNLFLIGPGKVGTNLINQIIQQENYLKKEYGLKVKVTGLANSKKMFFDINGIDVKSWKEKISSSGTNTNLTDFVDEMRRMNLSNSIFIDCTASKDVVKEYKKILKSNISIVTPNKIANSSSQILYNELKETAFKHNVKFAYETNVGAGLPIIGTLKDLVSSGDKIVKIEGILSGTLSYIFNSFDKDKSFSEIVIDANEKGFTEPDPRDDLKGIDVARKLLILAREIGINLELKQVKIENIVPEKLRSIKDANEFLVKLKEYNSYYEEKRLSAEKKDKKLCYIAELVNGKARIYLKEVGIDHPFYSLNGTDNILSVTTMNCGNRPIVIKGPGAGIEVTAAGVFADVIRISNYLS